MTGPGLPRRGGRWLAALALATLLAACYELDLRSSCFACAADADCPEGASCVGALCEGPGICEAACAGTLSGAGAVEVALDLVALRAPCSALSQRARCDASAPFWDLEVDADGSLIGYLGGSGAYGEVRSAVRVTDGAQHRVTFQRASGRLLVEVDGTWYRGAAAPAPLEGLPPPAAAGPCGAPACTEVSGTCLKVLP